MLVMICSWTQLVLYCSYGYLLYSSKNFMSSRDLPLEISLLSSSASNWPINSIRVILLKAIYLTQLASYDWTGLTTVTLLRYLNCLIISWALTLFISPSSSSYSTIFSKSSSLMSLLACTSIHFSSTLRGYGFLCVKTLNYLNISRDLVVEISPLSSSSFKSSKKSSSLMFLAACFSTQFES